ncbi:hypothetical protein QFZ35_003056 [Arthrobacter ulcerisalmonis]|nr:hypothetical protein [Arthrobacter ulcerisalmonis]
MWLSHADLRTSFKNLEIRLVTNPAIDTYTGLSARLRLGSLLKLTREF